MAKTRRSSRAPRSTPRSAPRSARSTPRSAARATPEAGVRHVAHAMTAHHVTAPKKRRAPRVRTVKETAPLPTPANAPPHFVLATKKAGQKKYGYAPGQAKAGYITMAGMSRLARDQGHSRIYKNVYTHSIDALGEWLQQLVYHVVIATHAAGRSLVHLEDVRTGYAALAGKLERKSDDGSAFLAGDAASFRRMRACHVTKGTDQQGYVKMHPETKKETYRRRRALGEGQSQCFSFPLEPFERMVKNYAKKVLANVRFTKEAINAVQYLAETHVAAMFRDAKTLWTPTYERRGSTNVPTRVIGHRKSLMHRNISSVVRTRASSYHEHLPDPRRRAARSSARKLSDAAHHDRLQKHRETRKEIAAKKKQAKLAEEAAKAAAVAHDNAAKAATQTAKAAKKVVQHLNKASNASTPGQAAAHLKKAKKASTETKQKAEVAKQKQQRSAKKTTEVTRRSGRLASKAPK